MWHTSLSVHMELQTWCDHHGLITRTRIGDGIFTFHHLCNTFSAYSVHSFVQYEANCVPLSLCRWLDATGLYCYTFMPNILHTVYLFITTCSQSADYMQKCLLVTNVCCQCTHHCQHIPQKLSRLSSLIYRSLFPFSPKYDTRSLYAQVSYTQGWW